MLKLETVPMLETSGQLIQAQAVTVDMLKKFILFIDAKPKTIETYTRSLNQFFKYLQYNGIVQPQRTNIIAYRDYLKTFCKPTTIQSYITAVRLFFQWTYAEGLYANVAEHVKGAKLDRGYKKDYLTSLQAKAVLAAIDKTDLKGKRDYAIITLMMTGGLRTIEIVRANFEDLRTAGNNEVLYVQSKGRDEKTEYVRIEQQVGDAMRQYLKALWYKPDGEQPLFVSVSNRDRGQRMTTRSVSRVVKRNFLTSGFNSDKLSAHSLRHTAITLALLNGENLQEVQQFARHMNITTTQIYAHNIDRASNKCEAVIANAIFS